MAMTEIIYPKNVGAKVAMNFYLLTYAPTFFGYIISVLTNVYYLNITAKSK